MKTDNRHKAIGNSRIVQFLGFALWAWLVALCLPADAQQAGKVARIGILPPGPISERMHLWEAFRQALRELGYVEGQNITLVFPSSEVKPERLSHFAAELVSLKVDIIVAATTSAAQAAMNSTSTIPIVAPVFADPVGTGLVASLARPGGNVTGLTTIASDLSGKRLALLKEVVPKVSRIAVLSYPSGANMPPQMRETEVTARALGVKLQRLEVRSSDDFERVFQAATKERAGALLTLEDAFFFTHRARIVQLAAKSQLPAIYGFREFVEGGVSCLMRRTFPTCTGAPPFLSTKSSKAPSPPICRWSSRRSSSSSLISKPRSRSA